jgi:hypothetical protein
MVGAKLIDSTSARVPGKLMQIHESKGLSFAFFYFSESGLFKGLSPIQAKKSDPRLRLCAKRLNSPILSPFPAGRLRRRESIRQS